MRRGFIRTAISLQWLVCRLSRSPAASRNLWFLKGCLHLKRRFGKVAQQQYRVLVINRECDQERLSHVRRQSERFGFEFERVDAVNCALPSFDYTPYLESIGNAFYGREHFLRGAVGCFLSHVMAWKRIAEDDRPVGLVCEDDIRVLGPLPQRIDDFGLPSDADLVFVNARMVHGALDQQTDTSLDKGGFVYLDFAEALFRIARGGPAPISGPGGDGYLLSHHGAGKLLKLFGQMKITMEVDWFLVLHSLSPEERDEFLRLDGTGRFSDLTFAHGVLKAYVMIPALVEQASMGTSIGFDKPANYIHKDAIFGK